MIELYGEEKATQIKNKLSNSLKGYIHTKERNKKISESKKGKKRPQWVIDKLRNTMLKNGFGIGKKNNNWKGGITDLFYLITESRFNDAWKYKIKKRDKVCAICGSKKRLQVHHLRNLATLIIENKINKDNWRDFRNVLFDINNGVLLCYDHHNNPYTDSLHQVKGRKKTTKEDFYVYKYEIQNKCSV